VGRLFGLGAIAHAAGAARLLQDLGLGFFEDLFAVALAALLVLLGLQVDVVVFVVHRERSGVLRGTFVHFDSRRRFNGRRRRFRWNLIN